MILLILSNQFLTQGKKIEEINLIKGINEITVAPR